MAELSRKATEGAKKFDLPLRIKTRAGIHLAIPRKKMLCMDTIHDNRPKTGERIILKDSLLQPYA